MNFAFIRVVRLAKWSYQMAMPGNPKVQLQVGVKTWVDFCREPAVKAYFGNPNDGKTVSIDGVNVRCNPRLGERDIVVMVDGDVVRRDTASL